MYGHVNPAFYNLKTGEENKLSKAEKRSQFNVLCPLPEERFAALNNERISIYCSRTRKLLRSIPLSLEQRKSRFKDPFISSVRSMSLSLDKKVLIVRGEVDSRAHVQRINKMGESLERQVTDSFFIDLENYNVTFRKGLSLSEEIQWLGDNQYISLAQHEKQDPEKPFITHYYQRCQIHSVTSGKIIPCEITDIDRISKIYAFPEQPSCWIVMVTEGRYDNTALYIYDVKKTPEKYVAVKGKKIGDCYYGHNGVFLSGNSVIFLGPKEKGLFEFDLNHQVTREVEIENHRKLKLSCIFPDGKLGFSAVNKEGKQSFVVAKTLARASKDEAELMDAMNSVFEMGDKAQVVTGPLQRIIAGYACRFFSVDKEEVDEDGQREMKVCVAKC